MKTNNQTTNKNNSNKKYEMRVDIEGDVGCWGDVGWNVEGVIYKTKEEAKQAIDELIKADFLARPTNKKVEIVKEEPKPETKEIETKLIEKPIRGFKGLKL